MPQERSLATSQMIAAWAAMEIQVFRPQVQMEESANWM